MSLMLRAVLALALALPALANASGRFNLNAELGVAFPLSGRYGTALGPNYAAQSVGPVLTLGVDFQVFRPLALEVIGEVGVFSIPSWLSIRNLENLPAVVALGGAAAGARVPLLDGPQGVLWSAAHVGVRGFDGVQFAVDASVGYQFTLSSRLGLGPAVKGLFLAPSTISNRGSTFLLAVAVSGSFELIPFPVPPLPDDDGDGLTNDAELTLHHTDPKKADTDGDGLRDDVELAEKSDPLKADSDDDGLDDATERSRKTDPRKADTDGDGLTDSAELARKTDPLKADTDGDGLSDGEETSTDPLQADTDADGLDDRLEVTTRTDALKADTDGDGLADGAEDKNHNGVVDPGETDPRVAPPPDGDHDGVPDASDNCPTEAGPVDNQGCPRAQKQLVVITAEKLEILEKVYFATRDASVLPKSFALLDQVAAVLQKHPELTRVQIEGHTDNVGDIEANLKLSQRRAEAVFKYLSKKVDPARLEPIGYGRTRPADTNDTPVGREKNRRVEFKIVGQ
jgi:outer membrane protein OmpA-like peptidoglycan-associated protein